MLAPASVPVQPRLSTGTAVTPRALSSSRTAVLLCVIVVVAAALRLYLFRGFWGTDDGEYALLANALANGQFWQFVDENYVRHFNAPAHLPYRIAFIAPLALLFRVFGVSEPVLAGYPLVISTLGVLLAFACGRHFFGARAGLIAAALCALAPVDVSYSTSYLPDGVASFYASAAVLLVVAFAPRMNTAWRLFLAGSAAGLLFGISWLTKESVTYLVPLCAVLAITGLRVELKRAFPLWLGVAVASSAVLLMEMSYYAAVRGDFMLRMHENERSFLQTQSYLFYEGSRFGWPVGGSRSAALVKRLFLEGPATFFLTPEFLFLPLFGLIAAARALLWQDRSFKVPALWMLTLILMYNFASPTFVSYTPLVLLHRYLLPILLPAAVLTAGLLVRLLYSHEGDFSSTRERRFWGCVVAVAMIGVCGYFTFRQIRDLQRIQPMYYTREIAALIGPNDPVYTDPLSRKALQFHWQYPAATRLTDFEGLAADAVPPHSFVLVDLNRLRWLEVNVSMWLTKEYGYHTPAFAATPPASWTVLWRNQYATLYRTQ